MREVKYALVLLSLVTVVVASDFCVEYEEPLPHDFRPLVPVNLGTVPDMCGTCSAQELDLATAAPAFTLPLSCGCHNVSWAGGAEPDHATTPAYDVTLSLTGNLTDCNLCLTMPVGVKVIVDVEYPTWLHVGDGWWGVVRHEGGEKLTTHVGPGAVELDFASIGAHEESLVITDAQVTSLNSAPWDFHDGYDILTITGPTTTVTADLEADDSEFIVRVEDGASLTSTMNLKSVPKPDISVGGGSTFVGSLACASNQGTRLRVWQGATWTGNVALTGGEDALEMQDATLTGNVNMEGGTDAAYLLRSTLNGELKLGGGSVFSWFFDSTVTDLVGTTGRDYVQIHGSHIGTVDLGNNKDIVYLRNATLPNGIVGGASTDDVYLHCGDTDISPLNVENVKQTCLLSEGSTLPCPCAPACVPVPPPPANFACSGPDAIVCSLCGEVVELDVVFVVDASPSMNENIRAVGRGLSHFVEGLEERDVTPRYSLVLTGLESELVVDFTDDIDEMIEVFARITPNTYLPDMHDRHQDNEATFEAIRMAYGTAPLSTFKAPHAHAHTPNNTAVSGLLEWRPYARRLVLICTDEDSDRPWHATNRVPYPGITEREPPRGTAWTYVEDPADPAGAWASELADTMAVLTAWSDQPPILPKTAVYGFHNPNQGSSRQQFGDPVCDTATGDDGFSGFDADATLACLQDKGYGGSLNGVMLEAGLSSRMFDITLLNDPEKSETVVKNFFDEVVRNVAGCEARKKRKREEPVEVVGKRQVAWQPECFDFLCDVFIGCYSRPRCDPECLQCTVDDTCYADQAVDPEDGCSLCLGDHSTDSFSPCGTDNDLNRCRLSECAGGECVRLDVCTQGCDMCCIGGDDADTADGICDTGTCYGRGDVAPVVDRDPSCLVCVPSIDPYNWTVDHTCMDIHHPTCEDGRRNGQETGPDCGGPICDRCTLGDSCDVDSDCGFGFNCQYEECVLTTLSPTTTPTPAPTVRPTAAPTGMPTVQPTPIPTGSPTPFPTQHIVDTPAPPAPTVEPDEEGEGRGEGEGDGDGEGEDGGGEGGDGGDGSDGEGDGDGDGHGEGDGGEPTLGGVSSVTDVDDESGDGPPLGLIIGLTVGVVVLAAAAAVMYTKKKHRNVPAPLDTFSDMDYTD